LPNSAQLEGTPIIPPFRVRAVVWKCGKGQTDTQRQTDTQMAVTINIHFASATPHTKCNKWKKTNE